MPVWQAFDLSCGAVAACHPASDRSPAVGSRCIDMFAAAELPTIQSCRAQTVECTVEFWINRCKWNRHGGTRWREQVSHVYCSVARSSARSDARPAAEDPIRGAELERDVHSGPIYSEVIQRGFLHDERNLRSVYEKLHFAPNTRARREKIVDQARRVMQRPCEDSAANGGPLSEDDQRILDMWGSEVRHPTAEATERSVSSSASPIAFRAGPSIRSGAWETHDRETLAISACPRARRTPTRGVILQSGGLFEVARGLVAVCATGRRYMPNRQRRRRSAGSLPRSPSSVRSSEPDSPTNYRRLCLPACWSRRKDPADRRRRCRFAW